MNRKIGRGLKIPKVLDENQIKELFEAVEPKDPLRDLMFLKCLYYLGLRISECIDLTKGSFDKEVKTVRIKGKGDSDALIPIPKIIRSELREYMTRTKEDKLFSFTRFAGWQKVKKYAKRAKLPDWVHPHTLRHSYATILLQKSGNLKMVQHLLRHKDLESTAIYTHIAGQEAREAVDEVFKK